ncbi:MAG: hypothetical protein HYV09_26720 [Deltaproteobacteria bacterium]|nr:hypothetical protein [Deltaproteobacteria bacterium]
MNVGLAVGFLALLAARTASACPCGGHEAYGPVETAPDEGESVTADAHVWLWFSESFHGLLPDRPAVPTTALRYYALVDSDPARLTLDAFERPLLERTLVELTPQKRWPGGVNVEVHVEASYAATSGAPSVVADRRLLSFVATPDVEEGPTWSGFSSVERVDGDSSSCGPEASLSNALLAEPTESLARPLVFLWPAARGAPAAGPPSAVVRVDDEILSLAAKAGCADASFAVAAEGIVSQAFDLAGKPSVRRWAAWREPPVAPAPAVAPIDVPTRRPVAIVLSTLALFVAIAVGIRRSAARPWFGPRIRGWLVELIPAAKTALVVGTVLCLVNGTFGQRDYLRVALNYLVPLSVASYSRFALLRSLARRRR